MRRKQKLIGKRSLQRRKGRISPTRISGRTSQKKNVEDHQLSPEWIRELKRRVKYSLDPVRYMLVSNFSRKFILYYDVTTDTFAMNDVTRGTLFKRREIAESVRTHLGKGVALIKFTVKGGRLKRLSAFRRIKPRSRRGLQRATGQR